MKKHADEVFVIVLTWVLLIAFICGMPFVWWFLITSEFWKGFLIGAHMMLLLCWLILD